jgi:Predicted membrane protein (DUF2243)
VANEEPNRSLLRPVVLVGIGVAGSLDEIVLHQLLRWHHLYDRGSQAAGLIADGIFHLASTATVVIGLVLPVKRWRTGRGPLRLSVAGTLLWPAASTCMTASSSTSWSGSTRSGPERPTPFPTTWCYRRGRRGAAGRVLLLRVAGSPSGGRGWCWPRAGPMPWRSWHGNVRRPAARPWLCPPT